MSKDIQGKIVDEIGKGTHETIEKAIDSVVQNYPTKKEDFYFATFDVNDDIGGARFDEIYKKRISHSNELELTAEIGKEVEKAGDKMLFFMSKERAQHFHDMFRQFEGYVDGVLEETDGPLGEGIKIEE
jgi:hypothetical protein